MSMNQLGIDVLLQFFIAFEGLTFWQEKKLRISKRFSFVGKGIWDREWAELRKKEHISCSEIIWRIIKLAPSALKKLLLSIPRGIYVTLCWLDDNLAKTPPLSFTLAVIIAFNWGGDWFSRHGDFSKNQLPRLLLYFILIKVAIKIMTWISNKIALKFATAPNPTPMDLEK